MDMSNKINKPRLVYLRSVGTLIDPETFMTYPAPQGLVSDDEYNHPHFSMVLICNLEVDIFEGIDFEECDNQWFEELSHTDLQTIVRLMSARLRLINR